MSAQILGIHHINAIAGAAQRNYNFYTKVLGLRLVKKTVNFDDPLTYHFYYGNENGTPGTILTFFPWANVKRGIAGNGLATEISYAVTEGSLEWWRDWLKENKTISGEPQERFGEKLLSFQDPDGLQLNLVIPSKKDNRLQWQTDTVKSSVATKGFHGVTLTLQKMAPTAEILTEIFGYHLLKQEENRFRFITDAVEGASIVDIIETPKGKPGMVAGGSNHHVAFRVKDEETLMQFREIIESKGLNITPKIDRNYFFSLYFREPGGVLFELATDNPGFTVDESLNELGSHLKLPKQYESRRDELTNSLPVLVY
jgi:glyoxalase family protein